MDMEKLQKKLLLIIKTFLILSSGMLQAKESADFHLCFLVCHGGPADHFATFVENLSPTTSIEIYATGPALEKLQQRGIKVTNPFSLEKISDREEEDLAEQIAKACSSANAVITDVGHPFDIKIQKALARFATKVPRIVYYDNPEAYVPGGYSTIAAEVLQEAQLILFANAHLAQASIFQTPHKKIDLANHKKVGVGYYPLHHAEKIAKRRNEERSLMRQSFFKKHNLLDKSQKILVYFGGNNEEYYSRAFPAFLSLLEQAMMKSDFTNLVIVLQQHPGAKVKNIDKAQFEHWIDQHKVPQAPKMFLSDSHSEDAQILADAAFYYQTSMGPQFLLAGIPIIQIGHETYEDILVKNKLSPSVTKRDAFIDILDHLSDTPSNIPHQVILEGLGIKTNWLEVLQTAIKEACEE